VAAVSRVVLTLLIVHDKGQVRTLEPRSNLAI
jgi:hypothetical protein